MEPPIRVLLTAKPGGQIRTAKCAFAIFFPCWSGQLLNRLLRVVQAFVPDSSSDLFRVPYSSAVHRLLLARSLELLPIRLPSGSGAVSSSQVYLEALLACASVGRFRYITVPSRRLQLIT